MSTSSRSSLARLPHPAVESNVTRLLMTTRQLLQALTDWSLHNLTDEGVSDIYVKLGNDLLSFITAFNGYNVDIQNYNRLAQVPDDLRPLLEHCLGQEPSPESFAIYADDIRNVLGRISTSIKFGQEAIKRQKWGAEVRVQEERQVRQQREQMQGKASAAGGYSHQQQQAGPSRRSSDRMGAGQQQQHQQPQGPGVGETSRSSAYSVESSGTHRVQLMDPGSSTTATTTTTDRSSSRATSPSSVQDGRVMGPRHQAGSAGYSSRVNARVGAPLPPAPPDAFRPSRNSPSPTPSHHARAELQQSGGRSVDTRIVSGPDRPAKSEERLERMALRDRPISPATPVEPTPPVTPPRRMANLASKAIPIEDTPPHLVSRFSLDSEMDPIESSSRRSMRDSRFATPPPAPITTNAPSLPLIDVAGLASPIGEVASGSTSATSLVIPDAPPTPAALASLTALQNSEALGRRASRRFSQYQIKQMLPNHHKGPSSSTLRHPRLESLNEGGNYGPQRPARRVERSAPPLPPIPDAYASASSQVGHAQASEPMSESRRSSSTMPEPGGEVSIPEVSITESSPVQPRRERPSSMIIVPDAELALREAVEKQQVDTEAPSTGQPDLDAPFKVFLQFGRDTKRVSLDRELVTSIVDLQGMFMSRFDYAPEGMELFPDVYIKDPVSGIAYHLEDLDDIKPDALLSLNLDPLDQVKQHFDNTITSLSHEIKDLKNSFMHSRRASALKLEVPLATATSPSLRAVDRGRDGSPVPPVRLTVSTETTPVAVPLALPDVSEGVSVPTGQATLGRINLANQQHDIQVLRRELGTMRQVYLDFVSQTKETFQTVRDQTLAVREVALTKLSGSRSLVDAAKVSLEKHSSETVQAVEDVSDVVDSIKEDVLKRQILPRATQMQSMQDDLTKARSQVEQLRGQITLAAPSWKQTWNQELKNVVEEQHLLQHQEKLTADLEDDIKQACEIFETLKEYVNQRQAGIRPSSAGPRKLRPVVMPEDDSKNTVSNLLLEIRTKESDPNRRLAAIEQQQRQREKEMAEKGDEFADELTGFVSGRKLKKTGGTEEAERVRMKKQEMTFKRMFSNETPRDGASSGASTPTVASSTTGTSTFRPGNVKTEEGVKVKAEEGVAVKVEEGAEDKVEDGINIKIEEGVKQEPDD